MRNLIGVAAAFAAGVAAMYYMDPAEGRRRRATTRDRGLAAGHDAGDLARAKSRHAVDRAQGVLARMRSGLSTAPVDDQQLHARIRSRLGRVVDHPGEVHIEVHEGRVVLRGTASRQEIEEMVSVVAAMRGVTGVENLVSTDTTTRPTSDTTGPGASTAPH